MKIETYLGIDVGSSSLKFAIIDKDKKLLKTTYLKNEGLISTTQKGLEQIANNDYDIKGCSVTGSGRKFLGLLVGADSTKTEIIAHSLSCLHYYPKTRTLLDIGAEDNKAITFSKEGIIEDFICNSMCAGGCGQTLEMIAGRLNTKIEDVGSIATKSTKRLNVSSKCGIFMNSQMVSYRNSGQRTEDILMGTIRGIIGNYLQMIQNLDIQPPYVFSSASAKNKAFVKCFEDAFKHEVITPQYCAEMGAIGSAILVSNDPPKQTKFKGFSIAEKDYVTEIEDCNKCENNCELTKLYEESNLVGTLGSRCGRF